MSSRKSSRLTRTTIFEEDDDDDEDVDDPSFEESEDIDDIELEEEEEEEEDEALEYNNNNQSNQSNQAKLSINSANNLNQHETIDETEPDSNDLPLKSDHNLRPIVASETGRLFLEAFSPIAEQAIDFLVAIAEPVSRPKLIHEYMLTEYSLYAAVSVGINADNIIQVLNKLCKTDLPEKLIEFIRLHTKSYGKVKLVLKDNHMFVESAFPDVLRVLLQDQVISDARGQHVVEAGMEGDDVMEIDDLGFTTRVQTFEPVTFERPVLAAPGGKGKTKVREAPSAPTQNIAYASANSIIPKTTSQVVPPPTETAPESEFIDLFDDDLFDHDPFDSMDDPLDNLDPLELEKLNRLLDGHPPEVIAPPKMYHWDPDFQDAEKDAQNPTGETDLPAPIPLENLDQTPEDLLNLDIRGITDPTLATSSTSSPQQPVLISSFEISRDKSEQVRKACSDKGFPMLEEYDFRADTTLPTLDISLRPAALLRPYQEKSLNKMFGNGRARSGIIVLPCGAGKTLVGVTAGCTVKKRVLVLCTSAVSVEQWAREFKSWTNVKEGEVAKFTSQHKELLSNDNGILISTYTMVTFSSKRAYDAQKMMDYITSREWGLLILDEVHVVPAEMFKKVLTIVAAHCKLGLTATLVREDDKIRTLNYLIGPKLYEANWLDLAKKGHIARVRCSEVWCDMTKEFYKEYLGQSSRKRQLLYVMNPSKIQVCQYLIEMHERLGDKVIVFSDNVFALKHYATKLNRPYIYGGSSTADRLRTLQQFKYNPAVNTIFLSKVGDTSIDIPEASCLIQISSHYGSRRQEAQRLGRILRAKKNAREEDGYNSFFYTLVSRDTEEVYYCAKRQQFLIDQGYSYDIITNMKDALEGGGTATPLVYQTINERLELLATILVSNNMVDLDLIDREDEDDFSEVVGTYDERPSLGNGVRVTQLGASMRSLSGADNMAYIEQRRGGRAGRSGRE